jgi:hypothetical protein
MIRIAKVSRALNFTLLMLSAAVVGAQSGSPGQPSETPRAPNEFGTQDYTVTTISCMQFSAFPAPGASDSEFAVKARQFLPFDTGGAFSGVYLAGVDIPSGAVIDFMGLETQTSSHDGIYNAKLSLIDRYGNYTDVLEVPSTVHAGQGWDTDYNPTALNYQLVRNVHNQLTLEVVQYTDTNASPLVYFGWVEIWWHRVVSPAPATATFNDVPTSHPFFQYVEALAASGITGGCGGGNYCPNNPVTRGQMAVFLAKALGLHWPY